MRKLGIWLALVATLMAAFAPSISRALMRAAPDALVEVCTPDGSRLVSLASYKDLTPSQPGSPADHHLQHCPYCALHAHDLALPPAPVAFAFPPPLGQAVPAAFLHAPATLHAWRGAQPRAPPLLG